MAAYTLRPLTLGEVLDVAFGLYRSRFSSLVTVAVVTQTVPLAARLYLDAAGGPAANLGLSFGILLVAFILGTIGTAASTMIISGAYLGHETTAGAALLRATGFMGTLIAISLSVGILVGLGAILFVIPGLIALSGYAVSTPTAVLEAPKRAGEAMSRSWNLTRGFRMKVFATMLVGGLLVSLPSIALEALSGNRAALVTGVVGAVLQILVYPYIYVLTTVMYYDLRVRKEGFDLEVLAQALQPVA